MTSPKFESRPRSFDLFWLGLRAHQRCDNSSFRIFSLVVTCLVKSEFLTECIVCPLFKLRSISTLCIVIEFQPSSFTCIEFPFLLSLIFPVLFRDEIKTRHFAYGLCVYEFIVAVFYFFFFFFMKR